MSTIGAVADIGQDITLTWSGDTYNVLSVDGPGLEADAVETTHSKSTNGWRTYMAGLKKAGEVSVDVNFNPAEASGAVVGESGTLVINFPDGSHTFTCGAILTGYTAKEPIDDRMTATLKWTLSGEPTWA